MSLLDVVCEETRSIIDACSSLNDNIIKKIPWNVQRSIKQIKDIASQYLNDVKTFIIEGSMVTTKRISFHLK